MELLPLSEQNRRASLGHDYKDLKIIYPEWSYDLHKYGHHLINEKLELIATEGIIRWYLKENTPFDIDYNYNNIMYFYKNPEQISYNDMISIQQIGKLNYIECFMPELEYETKYIYFIKNKIDNIYFLHKFGFYLCNIYDKQNIIKYIKNVYDSIKTRQIFFMYGSYYNYFIKTYPNVKNWGIIFQKYKVILEQISNYQHPDIYKVDIFVENIQQYIYTLIIKYIENFMIIEKNIIIIKDQEKLNNDKYLKYYKDLNNFL
jgi:hypothetical protein